MRAPRAARLFDVIGQSNSSFVAMSLLSPSPIIGTLRKVEGDGSSKDNVTNQLVDWLNEQK